MSYTEFQMWLYPPIIVIVVVNSVKAAVCNIFFVIFAKIIITI